MPYPRCCSGRSVASPLARCRPLRLPACRASARSMSASNPTTSKWSKSPVGDFGSRIDQLRMTRLRVPRSDTPKGMDAALFRYRPPIDLTGARLRMLAAALGPAYVRVSGTWANTTFFADQDEAPALAPAGFGGVLTRPQWRNVVDFAQAVDAGIVTSFAIGPGTRDARGIWTPDQAQHLLAFTGAIGGKIVAAEFMNEPDLAAMGGAPAGYDAAAYGRDFKLFRSVIKRATPETMILGPGAVGVSATVSRCSPHPAPASTRFPITIMARSRRDAAARARRKPRCRSNGSRAPIGCWPQIKSFATGSLPASRSGSRKPPMPPAAAIRGP